MPTPVLTFHVVRLSTLEGWAVHCRGFSGSAHPRRRDALEEAYRWKDQTHPTTRVRVVGDK
jgi:hypothetical protein